MKNGTGGINLYDEIRYKKVNKAFQNWGNIYVYFKLARSKVTDRCFHYIKKIFIALSNKGMALRRPWKPTPVFLFGEFHGQRSLGSYSS